jgi:hypothetical protein
VAASPPAVLACVRSLFRRRKQDPLFLGRYNVHSPEPCFRAWYVSNFLHGTAFRNPFEMVRRDWYV